jgi:hypothetical protein
LAFAASATTFAQPREHDPALGGRIALPLDEIDELLLHSDGAALRVAAQHRPQRHARDAQPCGHARAPGVTVDSDAGHRDQVGEGRDPLH